MKFQNFSDDIQVTHKYGVIYDGMVQGLSIFFSYPLSDCHFAMLTFPRSEFPDSKRTYQISRERFEPEPGLELGPPDSSLALYH